MTPNCTDCYYWAKDAKDEFIGECRRHAPIIEAFGEPAKWPTTKQNEWCGDYEPCQKQSTDGALAFAQKWYRSHAR